LWGTLSGDCSRGYASVVKADIKRELMIILQVSGEPVPFSLGISLQNRGLREYIGTLLVPGIVQSLLGKVIGSVSFAGIENKADKSAEFENEFWLSKLHFEINPKFLKTGICLVLALCFGAIGLSLIHYIPRFSGLTTLVPLGCGIVCLIVSGLFVWILDGSP
jgi:hypothetical protein